MRFVVACMLVACGSSNSAPGDDVLPTSIAPEDYIDALEAAECDFAVRCSLAVDRATCDAANIRVSQDLKSLIAAIADGTVRYDAEAAARCIQHVSVAPCTFTGFHVESPCNAIFTGQVPTGGACQVDGQCAGIAAMCRQNNSSCDTTSACCPGTCTGGLTESALGGPCDDGMHLCTFDAVCRNRVCATPQAVEGGACTELDGCANAMVCNLDLMTGMGTCKTPAASDAACVRSENRPCADMRDYCNAASLTCVRAAPVDATCVNGVPCVGYAQCVQNRCAEDLKLGESCSGPPGAQCAGTLVCSGGTCKPPNAGMICTL
jgi:hypothetical protein